MLISSVYPESLTLSVDLPSGRSGEGTAFKHGDTDSTEDSAETTGETDALLALHCSWSSAYETESANKTSSAT